MFFIVDSDDVLKPDAVENIKYFSDTLGEGKWAGLAFFREDKNGKPLDNIPEIKKEEGSIEGGYNAAAKEKKVAFSDKLALCDGLGKKAYYRDVKNTEREGAGLSKDKAEVYFTEVLKKYPFPEFDGETFISEEVVWNKIAADGYFLRFIYYPIYVCEYLSEGLTKSGNLKYVNNPKGTLCWAKGQIKIFGGRKRLAAMERYRYAVRNVKSVKETAADLGVPTAALIIALIIVRGGRKIKGLFRKGN